MASKLDLEKENKLLREQIRELRKVTENLQEKEQIRQESDVELPVDSFTFYRNSDREVILVRVMLDPEKNLIVMKETKSLGKSTDTANHKLRQSVMYKLLGNNNWKNGNVRGGLKIED